MTSSACLHPQNLGQGSLIRIKQKPFNVACCPHGTHSHCRFHHGLHSYIIRIIPVKLFLTPSVKSTLETSRTLCLKNLSSDSSFICFRCRPCFLSHAIVSFFRTAASWTIQGMPIHMATYPPVATYRGQLMNSHSIQTVADACMPGTRNVKHTWGQWGGTKASRAGVGW